jgi:hypothetical protein
MACFVEMLNGYQIVFESIGKSKIRTILTNLEALRRSAISGTDQRFELDEVHAQAA